MKTSLFSFSINFLFAFLIIGFSSCIIPVPEQSFWSNPSAEEYDVFDRIADNIKTFQKKIAVENQNFLNTLEQKAALSSDKKDWLEKANKAIEIGQTVKDYSDEVWSQILFSSGGKDSNGFPIGADQKIGGQQILAERGQAEILQNKITEAKKAWLDLIPENDFEKINNTFPKIFSDKNWVSEKTKNQRIGILQLFFAHLNFEIEQSKNNLLNYFWGKIGNPPIEAKRFEIVSNPKTNYVIQGDKFQTEIFLAPVLEPVQNDKMRVSINGKVMTPDDGVVKYSETASTQGDRKYKVNYSFKNPKTGEIENYSKDFDFKVGNQSISVSAYKMNVFYVGVDNPISISAAGIRSSDLKVSIAGGGGRIKNVRPGKYNVTVTKPGHLEIRVKANGLDFTSQWRAKRIPDPVAQISKKRSGSIGAGEFVAQRGVYAILYNFDFDAKCKIQGFELYRFAKRDKEEEHILNRGGRYTAEATTLIEKATPGDIYTFENVKARCPGDAAGRRINSMIFRIK